MPAFVIQTYTRMRALVRGFSPKKMTNRYAKIVVFVFVIAGSLILFDYAHAGIGTDIMNGFIRALSGIFLVFADLCIRMTVFFLRFFITLASYNNYINADVVQLGWIMVRDVANMFFVVALLVIAFATILGIEQYEWKKSLAKLVLLSVLINFSNLIAQLFIDIAHVFTITFLNAISATAGGNLINMFSLSKMTQFVNDVNQSAEGSNIDYALLGGSFMAFAFGFIAMIAMGAYTFVMALRVVLMWALIILSPLAFILSALPKAEQYADRWWKEFKEQVIVAPIMVFFLWLSFATFGTGQVVQDLANDDPGLIPLTSDSVGSTSASISSVTEWESMASFIVAIIFMFVGIKVVGESGAVGSRVIGSATNFGKKVFTIGSGYALGRWMVGKGAEGGKILGGKALYHAPIVGGAALKEMGTGIVSKAKIHGVGVGKYRIGGLRSQINRSKKAADLDKAAAADGATAADKFKAMAYRAFLEPSRRKEKRATDWKEAVERTDKILDESYSTSISKAGQEKLDATVELKMTEEMAQNKAAQKVEDRIKEVSKLNDIAEEYANARAQKEVDDSDLETEKDKKDLFEKTKKEVLNDKGHLDKIKSKYLSTITDEKSRKKAEGLIDRDGGVKNRLGLAGRYNAQVAAYSKAKAGVEDDQQRHNEYKKNLAVARQRDKLAVSNGEKPRFEKAVHREYFDSLEKQNAALNFREATEGAIDSARRIRGAKNDDEKRKHVMAAVTGLVHNMKKGSEDGMKVLDNGADNFNEEVVAGDTDAMVRKLLTFMTGEKVEKGAGNIQKAEQKVRDLIGDESYDVMMRELDAGLKAAAADGAVNVAGIINDMDYNEKTGSVRYRMVDIDKYGQDDKDFNQGVREYMAQENTNVSKLTGLKDMTGKSADGKRFVAGRNAKERKAIEENFNQIFANVTQGTRIHPRLLKEMNEAAQDPQQLEVLLPLFKSLAKRNQQSAGYLLNKLKPFAEKLIQADVRVTEGVVDRTQSRLQKALDLTKRRNQNDDEEEENQDEET